MWSAARVLVVFITSRFSLLRAALGWPHPEFMRRDTPSFPLICLDRLRDPPRQRGQRNEADIHQRFAVNNISIRYIYSICMHVSIHPRINIIWCTVHFVQSTVDYFKCVSCWCCWLNTLKWDFILYINNIVSTTACSIIMSLRTYIHTWTVSKVIEFH